MNKINYLISISLLLFITPKITFCQSEAVKLNDSLATSVHNKSIAYYKSKNYKKALLYGNKEVAIRRNLKDSSKYKNSLFNLGLFYFKTKQFYKSIETYKIVIDSFDVDRKTYQSYCNIGRNFKALEDYFKASEFFEKGLSEPKMLGNKSYFIHLLNFAVVNDYIESKKSLKKELYLLKKADSLSDINKLSSLKFYFLYFTYANYYKNDLTFDYKKSKNYYHKALNFAKKVKDTNRLIFTNNNLSLLMNKVKNDSVIYYLKKGIRLSKKNNDLLPKLYYNLSVYYFDKGKLEKALKSIHKALQSAQLLASSQKLDSIYEVIPQIKNLSTSTNKLNCIYILRNKGKYLLEKFHVTTEKKYLKLALENLLLADQMIDLIKNQSVESQSKLHWQKEASEVYLLGVKATELLNKPDKAFYFMEKNKALLLLENISENQLRKQANIPTAVLEKELEIKQEINYLENELNNNPSKKDSLEKVYYTSKIELGNYIESLKNSYPQYHSYKKPIEIVKLQDVQKKIAADTMILEYFLDATEGYVLAITKDKTTLHKLVAIENINAKIKTYNSLISKPLLTLEKQYQYNTIAKELYRALYPILKKELNQKISSLIIIPDYTLQNIPFESLKTTDDTYLIQKYEISYAYSLSFLEKNKTFQKPSKTFLGLAPVKFDYDNLTTLKNSKKEIYNANNYFSGSVLTDSLATKNYFVANSKDYKIIHLATHASVNDTANTSWIAFKNQKLYDNEIYTLKNNADLVVLSACKTSLGKINKGEGVFSLARSFFFSGSKSVISSLWNVNDKSSQEILSDFYSHLKNGKTKSEALRQAKLNYINTHQLSEKSPYYWSSMILIGDASSITSNSFSDYYPYLIVLIILISGFLLYKRIKK